MTETTITDAGALRVMLKLEQSMHDATKRQVTSLKAKLARKPEVVKVPTEAFRPICDADFEIDSEIIGYDEVTGAVHAASWRLGSVRKRIPDAEKGRMVHVCEDYTGWWVDDQTWHPTHFIPMPKRPLGTPE